MSTSSIELVKFVRMSKMQNILIFQLFFQNLIYIIKYHIGILHIGSKLDWLYLFYI